MVLNSSAFTREVRAIESSDVVIINGEGLVYSSDDRCTRSLFFIAYLAKKYLNTNCVMTNHTLDISDEKLHKLVENIYPMLDDVVFREPVSARKYNHLCSNHSVSVDPGFAYDNIMDSDQLKRDIQTDKLNIRPYSRAIFNPSESYVCVAGNSIYSTKSEYKAEDYLNICKELQKMTQNVLLVISAEADENLLVPVAEKLKLPIAGLHTSIPHSISLVANADLYVGGRYHPTIFAAKGGIPIIPFEANTHKIQGVLEILELDIDIFNPFKINDNLSSILSLAERYLSDPSEFRYLPQKIENIAGNSKTNVNYIRDHRN